jgi:hypothetical protein
MALSGKLMTFSHKRYRDLAKKVQWLQPILGFAFIWVSEGGEVTVEGDLKQIC